MSNSKNQRQAKKKKKRLDSNKAKVLKIREQLRKDAKAEKETNRMKRDIEKLSFQGTTVRGKIRD
jgi:DNA-binding transcriptional regulator GbsR (MarR family)